MHPAAFVSPPSVPRRIKLFEALDGYERRAVADCFPAVAMKCGSGFGVDPAGRFSTLFERHGSRRAGFPPHWSARALTTLVVLPIPSR